MSLYEQSYNHTSLAENYITDNTIILQYLESIRDSMVTKDSLNKTLSQLRNYDTLRVCDTLNDNMIKYNKERILNKHYQTYGELHTDNNGRYWCYIPDEAGKKKVIRKTRLDDLENVILSLPQYTGLKFKLNSFKDIYFKWVEYSKDLSLNCDNTIRRYETTYDRFFTNNTKNKYARKLESQNINSLNLNDLELFLSQCIKINGKNGKNLTKKTFDELWGSLNQCFNYAKRNRLIDKNYLELLDKSKFRRQCINPSFEQQNKIIDYDETEKLLQVIQAKHNEKNKTFFSKNTEIKIYSVELEIYLGLRPAEVSALKWCNIRFDDKDIEQGCYGTIVIQNSMKKRNGEYTLQDTKTGKTRTIPIDKRIYEVLQGVKKLTKSMRRRCEDYIFIDCNKDKTVPITPSSIGRCLTRLCDKAKIKSINPTTLRKSFNSRMKAQGTSSLVCSSMLGNDPVVNDKHYTYDCMSTKSDKILALKQANSKL